jgi:threonine dehydrogenase-like Zn-dependent dehydrogenase
MRYQNDGTIELLDIDIDDPQAGEIQVAGGACGICSWDIATAKYGSKMSPMAPPGHEGVGYVAKVGAGVSGLKEGDRVAGGGFATLRNLSAERVYKIPESTSDDTLWIVEPVSCAVTGLDQCQLRPGDKVVLIGCGFMGLLILQGLLHSFAGEVIALDINPDRLELAQKLGVGQAYNAAEVDRDELVHGLRSQEIDVVVDTSGSQQGLDLATDIVKRGGRINLFGWIKGERANFDPTKWHLGGFTIVNSSPSAKIRDPFPVAIDMIHRGIFDLKPLVTHTISLSEYPQLMQKIIAGEPSYIKGVVRL